MTPRENAWRVFASEFNESSFELTSDEERAPSYMITPLGAKVNRLYFVGVLTDLENVGEPDNPLWRGRVSDPTGVFYLSSGQFQPEATKFLSQAQPPMFVSVVGKVRTYSPEEGTLYLSIRPENIREATVLERNYWVINAAESLKKRLSFMQEAIEMDDPTPENVQALGCNSKTAHGISLARGHYSDINTERYEGILVDALTYIYYDEDSELTQLAEAPSFQPESKKPESKKDEGKEDEDREEDILAIIDKLDDGEKGANWDDILVEAKKMNISEGEVDELINGLHHKGKIFEPTLGKIKIV